MAATQNDMVSLFQRPGNYRIKVQGTLDESWSARMCGMQITRSESNAMQITTLEGHLRDQTQLSGILNNLYELHLSILSVELVTPGTHKNDFSEDGS